MSAAPTSRSYTLSIWLLALGYFLSYIPYSGLSKGVTSGLLTGGRVVPIATMLPAASLSTSFFVLILITAMGWWRYARQASLIGLFVPVPKIQPVVSGIGFAIIILTTTLAYSFSGVSILLALVLMRAGVLIMSPLIDWAYKRPVRWFSWVGLALSFMAVLLSFRGANASRLGWAALLNLGGYLAGYALRIPSMTKAAKTRGEGVALNYFVEEQAVAMPVLVLIPAVLAVASRGDVAGQLRYGYAHLFNPAFTGYGWAIGFFYAALGTLLSFIYLDRRENTFCMPLFACASLLSGIVATYLLAWFSHGPSPNSAQLQAALLLVGALLVLSPLHHMPLYAEQLRKAIAQRRVPLLTPVDRSGDGEEKVRLHQRPWFERFITMNLSLLRAILRRQ